MNGDVQTYPLNADKLEKGDTIDQETIERFLGMQRGTLEYQAKLLGLWGEVMRALDKADKHFTVVLTNRRDPLGAGAIRVLTDAEALIHNGVGFKHGLRKAARKHRRTMDIDPSKLTSEERKHFERNLLVQGSILASVVSARAKAVLKSSQRNAPPMIEHEKE